MYMFCMLCWENAYRSSETWADNLSTHDIQLCVATAQTTRSSILSSSELD